MKRWRVEEEVGRRRRGKGYLGARVHGGLCLAEFGEHTVGTMNIRWVSYMLHVRKVEPVQGRKVDVSRQVL